MLKLILVFFISTSAYSNSTFKVINLNKVNEDFKSENILKIGVDMWMTSKSGCKFHIVGNYNTWSGAFSGSVTASGPDDCPHGSWQFGMVISGNGEAIMSGTNPFIDELKSDDDMLNEFVRYLQLV